MVIEKGNCSEEAASISPLTPHTSTQRTYFPPEVTQIMHTNRDVILELHRCGYETVNMATASERDETLVKPPSLIYFHKS